MIEVFIKNKIIFLGIIYQNKCNYINLFADLIWQYKRSLVNDVMFFFNLIGSLSLIIHRGKYKNSTLGILSSTGDIMPILSYRKLTRAAGPEYFPIC